MTLVTAGKYDDGKMGSEAARGDFAAESLGESLRREREMRGVSLEEISAATKISVRMLQAIEGEDFSRLPSGIYGRSFIRSYARYLGLKDEPLLAEFDQLARSRGDNDVTRLMDMARPAPAQSRSFASAAWALLGAAILLGAGFVLYRYSGERTEAPMRAESPVRQAPSPMKHLVPVQPNPAAASSAPGAPGTIQPATEANAPPATPESSMLTSGGAASAAAGQTPAAPSTATPANPPMASAPQAAPPANDGLTLQVAATEPSWVSVIADGATVLQGVLQPNEVKTLAAKKTFDVTTGNAEGIVLTLNGHTLQPLGGEGEVKSIRLTRANLKQP